MKTEGTREAAETALRELPSVIGAFVREDVNGNPREVHLLIRAGPNPRHLAYDVRTLLEERLGVPIDQRVISIAQLAPGREPGPLLAQASGFSPAGNGGSAAPAAPTVPGGGRPAPASAENARSAGALPASEAAARTSAAEPLAPEPAYEPRMVFDGIATESVHNRARVRVSLLLDEVAHSAEVAGLDTVPARLRAAAAATLQAVNRSCTGRARFEAEHVSVVQAFEREYVVVTVLVSSPYLGRKPMGLVGAQPIDADGESAAVFAALKAANRTLSLILRLDAGGNQRDRTRARRS